MPDDNTLFESEIATEIALRGFIALPAEGRSDDVLSWDKADWADFTDSWRKLGEDRYMADGGRYRRRRHATFKLNDHELVRLPAAPHYQSRDYNTLNGGVERWFAPVEKNISDSTVLAEIVTFFKNATALCEQISPASWYLEMHQFRIEPDENGQGLPTPEGMHRDGVDWVFVMLIDRQNVSQGETLLAAPDGQEIGRFTLSNPGDAVFLNDHRVYHGVTPIERIDKLQLGWRDVLVLTLKRDAPQG